MTVGQIIEILEQFPRDQILEIGFLAEDDLEWLTCLGIADILISDKNLIIVDQGTSDLIRKEIRAKLNVRKRGKSDREEGPADEVDKPPEESIPGEDPEDTTAG